MMPIKITKRVDPPSLVWQIYRLGKKKGGCEYDRLMLKGKNWCWCTVATVTHMCELHGKWNNCINGPVSPILGNMDIDHQHDKTAQMMSKRPDSKLKTKPNNLICYQILPIVHQIVDENCRQFLNNYEE